MTASACDFDQMMDMEASEARGHGGAADSKSKPSFRGVRGAGRAVLAAEELSIRRSGSKPAAGADLSAGERSAVPDWMRG